MRLTVEQVRKLAMKHYEEGGDVIIECWTDEDIAESITTLADLSKVIDIRAEEMAAQDYFSKE